jgi:hypothetical protein
VITVGILSFRIVSPARVRHARIKTARIEWASELSRFLRGLLSHLVLLTLTTIFAACKAAMRSGPGGSATAAFTRLYS